MQSGTEAAVRREMAEDVATVAFAWMASDPDVTGAFLAQSGMSVDDLRARLGDPGLMGAVLDLVLTRDDWVIAVAAAAGLRPEQVAVARAALPGGDAPHWT
ncbi:MAG: DUF3572 domain-containing protein [Rhodobacteraceae bacterium]|jgi:hypothetical protein|nr:DUF3572 domain-containing protein [Paracoccaceae bacterium]